MPAERFYQLVDLISRDPVEGLVFETYQTCGAGETLTFCGREYKEFLAMDTPIGIETSLTAAVSIDVQIPWGNSRELNRLTSDYLKRTNYLANNVLRFTTLKMSDPNWFVGPIPYAVRSVDADDNKLTLTLQNPTTLVSQTGGLVQQVVNDQEFPELPRTVGR